MADGSRIGGTPASGGQYYPPVVSEEKAVKPGSSSNADKSESIAPTGTGGSSWQRVALGIAAPELEGPSFTSTNVDVGALLAQTLLLSVQSSQETSAAQLSRLKAAQGDFVKISDRTVELIDKRQAELEKALEAQEKGKNKFLGIGLVIAGVLGTVLSLGTLSAPAIALVAIGTGLTTLTAVNDLTDGKLFQDVFKLDEDAANKLSISLTVIGSVFMLGAGAVGSSKNLAELGTKAKNVATSVKNAPGSAKNALQNALQAVKNFGGKAAGEAVEEGSKTAAKSAGKIKGGALDEAVEETTKSSTKSADESAALAKSVAEKGGKSRSFDDITEAAAKERKSLAEKWGLDETEFLLRTQQAEVLLATVQGILEAVGNIRDFKVQKFQQTVKIIEADQQQTKADFTKLQADTELLLDRYQTNTQEGIVNRTQDISKLIDISLKTNLAHLKRT